MLLQRLCPMEQTCSFLVLYWNCCISSPVKIVITDVFGWKSMFGRPFWPSIRGCRLDVRPHLHLSHRHGFTCRWVFTICGCGKNCVRVDARTHPCHIHGDADVVQMPYCVQLGCLPKSLAKRRWLPDLIAPLVCCVESNAILIGWPRLPWSDGGRNRW